MDNNNSTVPPSPPRCFTEVLDRAIRDSGYSTRFSKKARRALFHVIARALSRGEAVETPIGTFRTKAAPAERGRLNPMRQTVERVYQRRRRIAFKPAPSLVREVPTWFYTDEEYALIRRVNHAQPLENQCTTDPKQADYLRAFLDSADDPLKN
jgi:nucleoid DNA-binding protein